MIAPITPHITEEIYHLYFKEKENAESIHISNWPSAEKVDEHAIKVGDALVYAVEKVRQAKSEKSLSLKSPVKNLVLHASMTELDFEAIKGDLISSTNAEKVSFEKLNADSSKEYEVELSL